MTECHRWVAEDAEEIPAGDLPLPSPSEPVKHLRVRLPLSGEDSICLPVSVLGTGDHPVLVLTAGVHGDEPEGVLAVYRLLRSVSARNVTGTVIAIPIANPPAFGAGTRAGPLDGKNLNRLFPGNGQGSPSEILADYLYRQVVLKADALVDLHSGGRELDLLPTALYPGRVDTRSQSADLAKAFGADYVVCREGIPSGVLFAEASRAGIAAIGVEAGGSGLCGERNVAFLFKGMVRVLAYLGMLVSDSELATEEPHIATGYWEVAPACGLLVFERYLGDFVDRGDVVARIYDLTEATTRTVCVSLPGVVVGVRTNSRVREGQRIAMIVVQQA